MRSLPPPNPYSFRAIAAHFISVLMMCAVVVPALAQPTSTAIVFYAPTQVKDDLWSGLFESLHKDLAAGKAELPQGLTLDTNPLLMHGNDIVLGAEFGDVIEVKLVGRCDVLPQAYRPLPRGPLGWVTMIAGEIQPFIVIDCTRLAQVLSPAVLGLDAAGRRDAMSQAIAHVLIHEWVHIALQSSAHGSHGITEANLSVKMLVSDPGKKLDF